MSTRCVLDFHDDLDDQPTARIYCRYNGQPKYQLPRLRKALDLYEADVHGLALDEQGMINLEMSELAALYVKVSKTGVGDVFITGQLPWNVEYLYQVFGLEGDVRIRVLTPTKRFVWSKKPRPSMMTLLAEGLLDDLVLLSFAAACAS